LAGNIWNPNSSQGLGIDEVALKTGKYEEEKKLVKQFI
jgi:hypothetical protein